VLRQDLGEHLVDAQLVADALCDLAGVAGDHRHVDAHLAQLGHGLARLGPDLVLESHRADDLIVGQVQDRRAAGLPVGDPLAQARG